MKIAIVVMVFAALGNFAAGADVPKDALTVRQALEIFAAIGALDKGGSKIIDGKEAHVPFILSATVRWTLSGDKSQLADIAERFNSESKDIQAQAGSAQKTGDQAAQVKFNDTTDKQLQPVLNAKTEVSLSSLKMISLSDLQLDTNPIDVDTLSGLRLIISDK